MHCIYCKVYIEYANIEIIR